MGKKKVSCKCDPNFTGKYCESPLYTPCGNGKCHNLNVSKIQAREIN